MCYYNGQKVTHAEFIRLKGIERLVKNYDFLNSDLHDGFDYKNIAVLKATTDKEDFDIVQMEWGFIPPYWKDREQVNTNRNGFKNEQGKWVQYTTLNAMHEEMLFPKKMYRDAVLKRRCLILSSGFYEWRHVFPTNKRTGEPVKTAIKVPHYIMLKDKPYFFMAGLWQGWTDKKENGGGEYVETCTIVTTVANELMAKIHNIKKRMPTILNDDLAWEWMFGDLSEERITQIGSTQYPSEGMQAHTIAKDFKTAFEPTKPFVYEDLPMIESNL